MKFTFELPRSNKELLEDANGSNYFVRQVYSTAEIPKLLRDAHHALKTSDAFYIFDHFDTFFSVIENVSQLQISNSMRAIDILYRTVENYGRILDDYLKQEAFDRQNDYLNLTKMVLFLMVTTVRSVDEQIKKKFSQPTGRKNKKNNNDEQSSLASYETRRYDVLVQICNIMQLPIEKLWNMSIIDENLVNLLCDLAYRSLSHRPTKEKRVNDAIFQILGTAIKQYRHGIAFPVQIVEIMDREESVVIPIARGVRYLNDEFGIFSVMSNLLKELIDKVSSNPASQTVSKNLSTFVTEIGEISPDLSLQCLELSEELLSLEPYAIRNSLFGVMNGIIVNHLSGEDLNDDQKTTRDEYLEDLRNHMNDVNSYVRSKVIQIWNDLKIRNAVPLAWIRQIVIRAVKRLEDKTATIRKNATILLRSFLESNPFSSTLQVDVNEKKLRDEIEKQNAIRDKMREQLRSRNDIERDYDTRCFPCLHPLFRIILNDQQQLNKLSAGNSKVDDASSEERVEKIRKYLKDGQFEDVTRYIIQLDALVGHQNEWKSLDIEEQILYFVTLLKTYLFDDYLNELDNQIQIVEFLTESLAFSKTIALAVPKLEQMRLSTTNTDALEAIEYFKIGYMFKIKGTEDGMRLMLRLLYINTGQDKNEKAEAVIKAYHTVLFNTDSTGRAHHLKVVDNLYHFLQNITTGEYTAFEFMIKHWVLTDEININIIYVLFERFTQKIADTSSNLARSCMELLILVSNTKPAVAISNKKLIIDIINSHRILEDVRVFSGCLRLLMITNLSTDSNGNKINKVIGYSKRFDEKDVIKSIVGIFKKFFFFPKLPHFEMVATQSIDFLYKMCNTPDLLSEEIIHDICKKLNEISQKRAEQMMVIRENGVVPSQRTEMYIPNYLLPRIIFIFGYIASKELVFLDNDVYLNIKYREELKKNDPNGNKTFNSDGSMNESSKQFASKNTSAADVQEQIDLGASAEDTLAEMIQDICENQLIGSVDGLLYHFVPILTEILSQPAKYQDEYVQRAAILTLMRFMVVSSHFSSDRIAFLMNILKKTKSVSMKCNIIIGLSDLTSRFANTIEPWIPNFYTMLLETDETVRLTAIKVLSYMILQGIIRATGQISEMAACIVDDSSEIQQKAQEFFRQLIESKESEFLKVIPDIVSRLSSTETPIAENKFQTIIRFLLDLIQKDRQVESFVEKLLCRFQNTNTERQWRDIVFCLSLLNHTEKTMKKLLVHLPHYKDKIQCDEIFDYFKIIITNANKQILKHELKRLAKEFDDKLQMCMKHGADANVSMDCIVLVNNPGSVNQEGTTEKEKGKKTGKGNNKKKPTKPKRKPRRKLSSDEEEDSDFE